MNTVFEGVKTQRRYIDGQCKLRICVPILICCRQGRSPPFVCRAWEPHCYAADPANKWQRRKDKQGSTVHHVRIVGTILVHHYHGCGPWTTGSSSIDPSSSDINNHTYHHHLHFFHHGQVQWRLRRRFIALVNTKSSKMVIIVDYFAILFVLSHHHFLWNDRAECLGIWRWREYYNSWNSLVGLHTLNVN